MIVTINIIEQMELVKREQDLLLLYWNEDSTRISTIQFKEEI